jgi:HlyD family secretion protein
MTTNRNLRIPITIILIVAIVAVGAWFYLHGLDSANGALTASGTIETTVVNIAPELSGKVAEVKVDEGDKVKAGDVLFRLDDDLLQAQRKVAAASLDSAQAAAQTAQAALDAAQAQYQITLDAALAQDQKSRLHDWYPPEPGQFNQPIWYFTRDEQVQAAQAEIDAAQAALDQTQAALTQVAQDQEAAAFIKAETRLAQARVAYLVAKDVYARAQLAKGTNASNPYAPVPKVPKEPRKLGNDANLFDSGKSLYDDAKDELDRAQQAYDDLLTNQAAQDVLDARADVSIAQERYYTALDRMRVLQTGDHAPGVIAAQTAVDQAQAALDQAQKAVEQTQAQLDQLDVQLAKLVVTAPMDGDVLTRSIEPGEVVNAGSVVLSLGRLDELTITVYVPEDRVGEVALGQSASVGVDSFPGESFSASVIHIADQAEFTPRNVQTVEGRKTTVFAIKLKLSDPSGKLKPGMPADVTFSSK